MSGIVQPPAMPVRTCVGCRGKGERSTLVRVVVREGTAGGPGSRELVVDERARMGGRGAWLHPDPSCLDDALRRRALTRALKVSAADPAQVRVWFAGLAPSGLSPAGSAPVEHGVAASAPAAMTETEPDRKRVGTR